MSRTERTGLCNAAFEAGAEAPTLSGDWTVKDLVIHLLVRERDPLAAPGIMVPPLSGLTHRASTRLVSEDFATLVERVRSGPPRWSPMAFGPLDRLANTLEYFVHHEDIRRGRPGWKPRELSENEQDTLWKLVGFAGRVLVRPAGVPVTISSLGRRDVVLRKGAEPAVISGLPSEIVLFLYGRDQVDGVSLTGAERSVERLKSAVLGL